MITFNPSVLLLFLTSDFYRSVLLKALHVHRFLISFIPTHAYIDLSPADLKSVKRYINMRKALDISRLTRPARIRCRPYLFLRRRSFSSSASRSKPLGTPAKASNVKEEEVEKSLLPAFGARRAEMEDYILAMEMAKLEDGYAQPRGMSNRPGEAPVITIDCLIQPGRFANPNFLPYMILSLFCGIHSRPRHPRLPHPHERHNQAGRVKRKK